MEKATTIEEQIDSLRHCGMIIPDPNKAREVLLDIGFYRLSFYWMPLQPGTDFNQVVRLYYFDRDLRNVVLNAIQRIEVNFRASLVYHASLHYQSDPLWHRNPSCVSEGFVLHDTSQSAAWKVIEFMSLGEVIKLYESLLDESLRETIIERYHLRTRIFSQFIQTTRIIRNCCAHGQSIHAYRLDWPLPNSKFLHLRGHNDDIVGVLLVVNHLLCAISENRSRDLLCAVRRLVEHPDNACILPQIQHLRAFYEEPRV